MARWATYEDEAKLGSCRVGAALMVAQAQGSHKGYPYDCAASQIGTTLSSW